MGRNFLTTRTERVRRHVRTHLSRALVSSVSSVAVLAGFLSAAGVVWPLWSYVALCIAGALVFLGAFAVPPAQLRYVLLAASYTDSQLAPRRSSMREVTPGAPVRRVASAAVDDPVYLGGLRALLPSDAPLIVVPSGSRDLPDPGELPVPIRANRKGYSFVQLDRSALGVPVPDVTFSRELPAGAPDGDHSGAVRDLTFAAQLAAALTEPGHAVPLLMPEHCVDARQLADHDVVVVGGPDVNFWHAALYETVFASFATPASSVPLAMGMRSERKGVANYGSTYVHVNLDGLAGVFPLAESDTYDIDDRLYPAYGMILACRNPFAAALGKSHWCTFVAGLTSVATAGSVHALAEILHVMRADPERNFHSPVPTTGRNVQANVSALLCRVMEVEYPIMRRDGALVPRQRHSLPAEGRDPHHSSSGTPTKVQYLDFRGAQPLWRDVTADQ
ncbi:hypothetical protein [Streptomyces sp. NPDC088760]|uniref:hypothetical protein n=1 Tax=Streptomyces sp. NPDC088760 TaxID=3365890 RepID=UPI0038161D79